MMILYFMLIITLSYASVPSRNPFPDQTDDNFQDEALSATNTYRELHHTPPLVIDQEVVDYAKSRCQLISQYKGLDHGYVGLKSGFAENQYLTLSSKKGNVPSKMAIDSWYSKVDNYIYSPPGAISGTGHFTRLVCLGSKSVGCARCGGITSKGFETYIVCNYSPAGNLTQCFERIPFPDETDDRFQNECLSLTNEYRTKHHALPLQIDQTLVRYAKSRCQLISQYNELDHGHAGLNEGYGENQYWSSSSGQGVDEAKEAIVDWYNEVENYLYTKPEDKSSDTGHFTQLVWKGTNSVGCSRCGGKGLKSYETYIVCIYSPAGNVVGLYSENVVSPRAVPKRVFEILESSNLPMVNMPARFGTINSNRNSSHLGQNLLKTPSG